MHVCAFNISRRLVLTAMYNTPSLESKFPEEAASKICLQTSSVLAVISVSDVAPYSERCCRKPRKKDLQAL